MTKPKRRISKRPKHPKIHVLAEIKPENIAALKQQRTLVVQPEGLAAMAEMAKQEPVVLAAMPKSWLDKAADWLLGTSSEPPAPGDEPF